MRTQNDTEQVSLLLSPLDVPRVQLGITTDEIVRLVRDGRDRLWDSRLHRFVWPYEEGYADLAKDVQNIPQGNRN